MKRARSILLRFLAFAALWWVLTEGNSSAWGVGLVSVLLAVAASLWLWPSGAVRLSLFGIVRYVGYFLWQSVRGGVAVAALAMRRRLEVQPRIEYYALRLPPGPSRVLLADTLSLLPGTVSTGLVGDRLRLHVLDAGLVEEAELRRAEAHVAAVFALELGHA